VPLPLPLRNRLAELIVDALHDVEARRGLQALATTCADAGASPEAVSLPETFPRDWFERRHGRLRLKSGWSPHAAELRDRSQRAWRVLQGRPLDPPHAPLGTGLGAAALLFDAGLYFEVHELLEPYWMRATGPDREALQGLIQIAVAFQHLANGNVAGARALLHEGCAKTLGRRLQGLDVDPFARGVRDCLTQLDVGGAEAFDWTRVPRFATEGAV
jgi:Domain of unknown function (DUF309)